MLLNFLIITFYGYAWSIHNKEIEREIIENEKEWKDG